MSNMSLNVSFEQGQFNFVDCGRRISESLLTSRGAISPSLISNTLKLLRMGNGWQMRTKIQTVIKNNEDRKTICALPHLACAAVVIPKLTSPELAYLWSSPSSQKPRVRDIFPKSFTPP